MAASRLLTPASFASNVPECGLVSCTCRGSPPIHHSPHPASPASGRSTLIQPRTPYEPATRPMSTRSSGGLLGKLFHEALRAQRELRALAGPVLDALHVDAQPLAALRGLRVVKPEPFEELAARRAARIRDHQMEERPLVEAAALQSNHNH